MGYMRRINHQQHLACMILRLFRSFAKFSAKCAAIPRGKEYCAMSGKILRTSGVV